MFDLRHKGLEAAICFVWDIPYVCLRESMRDPTFPFFVFGHFGSVSRSIYMPYMRCCNASEPRGGDFHIFLNHVESFLMLCDDRFNCLQQSMTKSKVSWRRTKRREPLKLLSKSCVCLSKTFSTYANVSFVPTSFFLCVCICLSWCCVCLSKSAEPFQYIRMLFLKVCACICIFVCTYACMPRIRAGVSCGKKKSHWALGISYTYHA